MREPSFDTWTIIFLIAAIQGIFVSFVFFFGGRQNQTGRILLGLITLLFSLTLTEYVLWWTGYLIKFIHFFNLSFTFPFLFGPLVYYYFLHVFEKKKPGWLQLLPLLPFVLNLLFLSEFYLSDETFKTAIYTGKIRPQQFPVPWHWFKVIHLGLYAIAIIHRFNAQSRSQHEVKVWFNYLTGFYIAFVLSFTSYYVLATIPGFNKSWDYMISFSMMFFIYFLAWFGYMQPGIFRGFTLAETIKENINQQKYKHSPLTDDISDEIVRKLETIMQKDRLYAENDLRLEKLAAAVGTGKHNLSQVINEKIGMTFFEYINSLRIREAQQLLTEKHKNELNVIEIAYKVGFNNKVSFNTTFKKITGMTPTEYRKQKSLEAATNLN